MLWSVVVLAMGGISLGKAVESSGLLQVITDHIAPYLSTLSTFHCLVLFSGIVLLITSFISHTVGALIILPVVEQVGNSLPGQPARIMVRHSHAAMFFLCIHLKEKTLTCCHVFSLHPFETQTGN